MSRKLFYLLVLLLCTSVFAGFNLHWLTDIYGKNGGHTTCNFLTLPVSAVELARGAASSPGANDATDLLNHSATTALANRNKFALHHLEWLMGLRKEYLGALFPILDIGTIGFYSQMFTPGKILDARDINENPSHPSLIELSIGATFSRSFFNRFLNVGIGLSYIESRLDHEPGRAVAGAADVLLIPTHWFSSRLYFSDLGTDVSYSAASEPLPLRAGLSFLFHPLPSILDLTSFFDFDIGVGVQKIAEEPLTAGISTEIKAGKYVRVRTGYDHTIGSKVSLSGLGIGAGLHKGMYGIDAAWRNVSEELGSVWSAGIKIQLEEIHPRTAEDYFLIAQKHYNKRRLRMCELYAKRALRMDPNMWKAHTLLSRMRSDILRNQGKEIALIYTGNLQGQFLIPPEEGGLGGIARITSAVKALRSRYPVSFAIENGNLLTGKSHQLRVQLADVYHKELSFDGISCGSGELEYGIKRFSNDSRGQRTEFICTNHRNSNKSPLLPYRILEKSGYRFYVATFIAASSVSGAEQSMLQPFSVDQFSSDQARTCDLRILIMHDSWENIKVLAPQAQGVDIIICGSIDQHFTAPMKIGTTTVLSAGSKGQYVGNLVLRFDGARRLLSFENKLIPMSSDIIPDSLIRERCELIAAKIDLAEQGIDEQELSGGKIEGTFPFVSDRDGEPGIFLKVIPKHAEFPLTRMHGRCDKPALSFTAGKIAYRAGPVACGRLEMMDISGTRKRVIMDSCIFSDGTFSPDGTWFYYAATPCGKGKSSDIYRSKSTGGPSFPVIQWENSNEKSISFSRDMKYMLFCSDRDGSSQIYLTNPEGEKPIRITEESAKHVQPSFSTDGNVIAYLSDKWNSGGKFDLWVYDRINGVHKPITRNSNVKSYCWRDDSRTILFSSGANVLDINSVDIVAFRFSKLIEHDTVKTWSDLTPRIMQFAGKEKVVYTREYENGEKQLFWVNLDGRGDRVIVNSKGSDWE